MLDSILIDYKMYVMFWQFLPDYIRIRSPKLIFRATVNGYNIRNFYKACEEYNESYHFCLIIIKTTEGAIFGCLIDEMPVSTSRYVF